MIGAGKEEWSPQGDEEPAHKRTPARKRAAPAAEAEIVGDARLQLPALVPVPCITRPTRAVLGVNVRLQHGDFANPIAPPVLGSPRGTRQCTHLLSGEWNSHRASGLFGWPEPNPEVTSSSLVGRTPTNPLPRYRRYNVTRCHVDSSGGVRRDRLRCRPKKSHCH